MTCRPATKRTASHLRDSALALAADPPQLGIRAKAAAYRSAFFQAGRPAIDLLLDKIDELPRLHPPFAFGLCHRFSSSASRHAHTKEYQRPNLARETLVSNSAAGFFHS
ncbi:MAG TPA: hypothetical protein VKM54_08320 [Myxococcota bacterium]|nr:hypothetical protein [Myxococcota bacterium]